MLKRAARSFIHLLAGVSAGLVILASLAAWSLSQGPVSLGFLNPYIEDGLNSLHSKFHFKMDDTVLTWAGWDRTLDVRIMNVQITNDAKEELASLPEIAVALNGQALFSGIFAPKRIELFRPSLVFAREVDGHFEIGFEGGGDGGGLLLKGMLAQLAAAPTADTAMSYLERVNIVDASVRIEDKASGRTWRAPTSQLEVWRQAGRMHADLALNLASEDVKAKVKATGSLDMLRKQVEGRIAFSPLVPAEFSDLSDVLSDLSNFTLPVSGDVTISADRGGGRWSLKMMDFDVHGGAGTLSTPGASAQIMTVTAMRLRGQYDGVEKDLTLDEASVTLAPDSHARLPAWVTGGAPHDVPLSSLALKGQFAMAAGDIALSDVTANLGGVDLQMSMTASGVRSNGDTSAAVAMIDASLTGLPGDKLTTYWPQGWGQDARDWAVAHLSGGHLSSVKATTRIEGTKDGFTIAALDGTMDIDAMTVDYLAPLPPVTGASGHVVFDSKTMNIAIKSGQAGALTVRNGTIGFTGLDAVDQYAAITLTIDAGVKDVLAFVDREPLGFASALGIDPTSSQGETATTLNMNFLLAKDLTLDGVQVAATALLRDVALPKVLFGLDLTDGTLNLSVDKDGMDVTGAVQLGPMPVDFAWRRNFGATDAVQSHYRVIGRAEQINDTRDLGFDLAPFPNEFIRGAVNVDVEYAELRDEKAEMQVELGLGDAMMILSDIGWRKQAGVPATAHTHVLFDGGRIAGIPDFSVKAGDMDIAGVARYAADGTGVQRVDFDRVKFARNDFAGSLISLDSGGWQIVAHGPSLDFAPILERLSGSAVSADELEQQAADLSLSVTAELDRVWMAGGRYLDNVNGTISRDNDTWQSIRINAEAGNAKDLKVVLERQGTSNRLLSVTSMDAGAVMSAFGFYDNMRGGALALAGGFDDTKPGQPFAGKLRVTDFNVVNAPTIAHLVSIMALTGIVDALKGEGLSFQTLEVPMTWREGVLSMKNARASGLSLGFTASGKVYWDAEVINIEGTLVPAYALNSVFGKIPLLGGLLTGGEEGSGVFAATYSVQGALEKPKVTVNPLSALAPGFLRNLFDIFTPTVEAPKPEAGPPPAPTAPQAVPEKKESL